MDDSEARKAEFDEFAQQYRTLLDQSVTASGESGEYFARYKAHYLRRYLGPRFRGSILDYGCGVGMLTGLLLQQFPDGKICGFDPSPLSVRMACESLDRKGVVPSVQFTADPSELPQRVDVILLANVMHHVPPPERQSLIASLARRLSDAGRLIVFEHNPANPLTRAAVAACEFDRDAVLLRPAELFGYLRPARLDLLRHDYIVFFPRPLKWFRPLEKLLSWCPMGAQYVVVSHLLPASNLPSSASESRLGA